MSVATELDDEPMPEALDLSKVLRGQQGGVARGSNLEPKFFEKKAGAGVDERSEWECGGE